MASVFTRHKPPDDWLPHAGSDDDGFHIRPFARRSYAPIVGAPVSAYVPSYATLDGPHFRIGYQGYAGVSQFSIGESESDRHIGGIRMRPPLVPRRGMGIDGVRNAITFVQSMPYESWPVVMPRVSRR